MYCGRPVWSKNTSIRPIEPTSYRSVWSLSNAGLNAPIERISRIPPRATARGSTDRRAKPFPGGTGVAMASTRNAGGPNIERKSASCHLNIRSRSVFASFSRSSPRLSRNRESDSSTPLVNENNLAVKRSYECSQDHADKDFAKGAAREQGVHSAILHYCPMEGDYSPKYPTYISLSALLQ